MPPEGLTPEGLVPASRLTLLVSLLWGGFIHFMAGVVGGALLLTSAALRRDRSHGEDVSEPQIEMEAARWVFGQLFTTFLEVPQATLLPEDGSAGQGPSMGARAAWALLLAGTLALLAAGLGLAVLTRAWGLVLHQPSPLPADARKSAQRALLRAAGPYALVAALLLAWQAEAAAFLSSSSTWAHWGDEDDNAHRRRELYQGTHAAFSRAYALHQCKGVNKTKGQPLQMSCTGQTFEARLLQASVRKLCRVRSSSSRQVARLTQCFVLGEKVGLSREGPEAESYGFYCRCWAASLSLLPAMGSFLRVLWLGMFLGALSVFLAAAEPGMAAMQATARGEILAFGVGVASFLAAKAVVFRPLMYDL